MGIGKKKKTQKQIKQKKTPKGDLPHSHFILFQIIITWFNQI